MKNALHVVNVDYAHDTIAMQDERDRLLKILFAECGFPDLPIYYRLIEEMLCNGLEPDLIEVLIEATAEAPRPTYAYLRACYMNCKLSGIKTAMQHALHGKKGFQQDKAFSMDVYNAMKFGERH